MQSGTRRAVLIALQFNLGLAACATTQTEPATPAPVATGRAVPTAADIAFMQDMIGHHSQALVMARMVPDRTTRNDMRILAERIIVSQQDESDFMRQWLRDHGAALPDSMSHAGHTGGAMPTMPGMLSPEQLGQLGNSTGAAFERLFLRFMIQHHSGAIVMVDKLFGTYGAGQNDLVFKFATDVGADQESEIARMQSMLDAMPASTSRP